MKFKEFLFEKAFPLYIEFGIAASIPMICIFAYRGDYSQTIKTIIGMILLIVIKKFNKKLNEID